MKEASIRPNPSDQVVQTSLGNKEKTANRSNSKSTHHLVPAEELLRVVDLDKDDSVMKEDLNPEAEEEEELQRWVVQQDNTHDQQELVVEQNQVLDQEVDLLEVVQDKL